MRKAIQLVWKGDSSFNLGEITVETSSNTQIAAHQHLLVKKDADLIIEYRVDKYSPEKTKTTYVRVVQGSPLDIALCAVFNKTHQYPSPGEAMAVFGFKGHIRMKTLMRRLREGGLITTIG